MVPAKAAGYLYNPDANDSNIDEISLHLIKEGGFTNYRIESDPPGLLCDESCPETVQRLPAGKVTLIISGNKPFPLLKIPLRGVWTEGCDDLKNETDKCVMNLNETNSRVTLEVDPNVQAGTIMPLPDGSMDVMFIYADSSRGHALVAAHTQLAKNRSWLDADLTRLSTRNKYGINDPADGTSNSTKLVNLGSEAASYCHNLNSNSGWYLPARKEIEPLTKQALDKIHGLESNGDSARLWTSTEANIGTNKGGKTVYFEAMSFNTANATIVSNSDYFRCPTDAASTSQCDIYRYQVLCVKRLHL
ncbi:hypothetical protein AXE65_06375 [Ventosimonas gracilis]|uniref:Uncharacterized protein n=1 Tax=Ventosimonas gracilis TaxID=1680762 RepID=A0A139SLD4_9GAMM|nr:hypothetical protein AXE65_06375 [Ventosimonas gracilis]